jgi:hypothetical protein
VLTANAEASAGENGASLGAGANIIEGSVTMGNFNKQKNTDEQSRFGLSLGLGAAGRTHWGDSDNDGYREFGFGADFGPISFDVKTEDPLRSLVGGVLPFGLEDYLPGGNWSHAAWDAGEDAYDWLSDKGSDAIDGIKSGAKWVGNQAEDAYDWAGDKALEAKILFSEGSAGLERYKKMKATEGPRQRAWEEMDKQRTLAEKSRHEQFEKEMAELSAQIEKGPAAYTGTMLGTPGDPLSARALAKRTAPTGMDDEDSDEMPTTPMALPAHLL